METSFNEDISEGKKDHEISAQKNLKNLKAFPVKGTRVLLEEDSKIVLRFFRQIFHSKSQYRYEISGDEYTPSS